MKKIVVIDNYDSFTYNLVHYLRDLECEVMVFRNDNIDQDVLTRCDAIVLSPGPGIPSEAGDLMDVIDTYKGQKPILGICLGHQAIAESYGGKISNMKEVFHGMEDRLVVEDREDPLFEGLPEEFNVAKYHSWIVKKTLPKELKVIAKDVDGRVMAIRHEKENVVGLQFHPESIITENGKELMKNWINTLGV